MSRLWVEVSPEEFIRDSSTSTYAASGCHRMDSGGWDGAKLRTEMTSSPPFICLTVTCRTASIDSI